MVKRTLTTGGYEAEFFVDTKTDLVHWVVTRVGDAEIIMWGQEKSMHEAERAALDYMTANAKRISNAG